MSEHKKAVAMLLQLHETDNELLQEIINEKEEEKAQLKLDVELRDEIIAIRDRNIATCDKIIAMKDEKIKMLKKDIDVYHRNERFMEGVDLSPLGKRALTPTADEDDNISSKVGRV